MWSDPNFTMWEEKPAAVVEDDDPVVDEIPLFHAAEIGSACCLVQFPLIPRGTVLDPEGATKGADDNYTFVFLPQDDNMEGRRHIYAKKTDIAQPLAIGVLRSDHLGSRQLHLTPIHQVYQGRPAQVTEEMTDVPIEIMDLATDKLIARSHEEIFSSIMKVGTFQGKLADAKSDLGGDLLENISDEIIRTRSPREQLYLMLVKEKTIYYDDLLKNLGLKQYAVELVEVLLEKAYFVQGRWTVKPEELPETVLSADLRLARAFMIVVFGKGKKMSLELLQKFMEIFNLQKTNLSPVLQKLGIKVDNGKNVSFGWKYNKNFETQFPEAAEKGMQELDRLKDQICMAKRNEHLFDPFLL